MAAFINNAVLYLGASLSRKILLAMRPALFPHAIITPDANARALRFGIFVTAHAVPSGLVGYACWMP